MLNEFSGGGVVAGVSFDSPPPARAGKGGYLIMLYIILFFHVKKAESDHYRLFLLLETADKLRKVKYLNECMIL